MTSVGSSYDSSSYRSWGRGKAYSAILAALFRQGTPADSALIAWLDANYSGQPWAVLKNPSDRFTMQVRGSGSALAWWGDGASDTYALSGTNTAVSHTYASSATRGIIILGNQTQWESTHATDGTASWTCRTADLPSGMTSLSAWGGSNAVTGALSDLPSGMTSLSVGSGSNAVTGALADLPSGMTSLSAWGGSNALTGALSDLPSGMTSLDVAGGSNAVTGALSDLPSGMTYLSAYRGSNALTGALADLPSGMTYLSAGGGSNAVTGALSDLPSGMTYLSAWGGSNALTGPATTLPSPLSYLRVGGLTSGVVDDALCAMAANVGASKPLGDRIVQLNEDAAQPRTSASDSCVSTLTSNGYTVTTA